MRVTERVEQVRREMAIERLTELREDWTEVRNSAGFKQWFVIQPADYQQRINSSWKPSDVISAINAQEAHVKKATSKKQDNTKRLDAAITPTKSGGVALPTMSVLDAMEYGLKTQIRSRSWQQEFRFFDAGTARRHCKGADSCSRYAKGMSLEDRRAL